MRGLYSRLGRMFKRALPGRLLTLGIGMATVLPWGRSAAAAEPLPWEISPYRVHITVAVDDRSRPQAHLAEELDRRLRQRIAMSLRPLWTATLAAASDAAARRFSFDPAPVEWDALSPEQRRFDKLFWLGVKARVVGYQLTCREFDGTTRRWGPRLRRDVAQSTVLTEAAFRLLADAFHPVARYTSPDGQGRARLAMKGGALPRAEGRDLLVAPGDVYLPLLRRTGRGGEFVKDGIASIPWTYLVAEKRRGSGWTSRIESALRGSLSGRRRGSIEQLAISLRGAHDPVRVRFYARTDPDQPLAGYEVLRLPGGKAAPEPVGLTDRHGAIVVPSVDGAVMTLLLRSDGQVLAKLMVAAGTAPTIDAPIADDALRLAAQGEIQAVREELVDIVARRAILIARVRSHLKKNEASQARDLMDQLNDLPTPSAFVRRLEAIQDRLPQSKDPRVRQAVDGLFTATRDLLARFLDARALTNLQTEVNAAGGG